MSAGLCILENIFLFTVYVFTVKADSGIRLRPFCRSASCFGRFAFAGEKK